METIARRLDERAPELAPGRWDDFVGEVPGYAEWARRMLLASADSLENPIHLVSAWDGPRLRGLLVASEGGPPNRRALVITMPGSARVDRPNGIWVAAGEDEAAVSRALLERTIALGRELRASWLTIGMCPVDDRAVPATAAALGFRAGPSQLFHVRRVAEGLTTEQYVQALPTTWRRNFRYKLRTPAKEGAAIAFVREVTDAQLERMWTLLRAMFDRKEQFFRYAEGQNLLRNVQRRCGAVASEIAICTRGDDLLCFFLTYQNGPNAYIGWVGYDEGCDFNVYACTMAHLVVHEVERGTRLISNAHTSDETKRHLGFDAFPVASYFTRL